MTPDFWRGILLKVAFKPEALRRAQAALLYAALEGYTFTADCLPGEIVGEDTTLAGCAVGALATMRLIERTGRCKSPAASRNGAWVNVWRLAEGRRAVVLTWLERHGFPCGSYREQEFNFPPVMAAACSETQATRIQGPSSAADCGKPEELLLTP